MAPALQERTPLDLLSSDLSCYLAAAGGPLQGQVFSWGNGSNYQLGTGAEGLQLSPVRLDSLHEASIVQVAAAKFHSAAVTQDGRLFTWGFGRGGRLGEQGWLLQPQVTDRPEERPGLSVGLLLQPLTSQCLPVAQIDFEMSNVSVLSHCSAQKASLHRAY